MVHAKDRASGNRTTLVLTLSDPVYNASAGTLAFNVTPAAAGSKPKLQDGAAAKALSDARGVNLQAPVEGLLLTVRAPCILSELRRAAGLAELTEETAGARGRPAADGVSSMAMQSMSSAWGCG